ncbi:recombinase family protein [Jannaschia ovalis]|uniref:Recombinase family protein n=1 Tax=Jannaschia ovalis TaxID=3038773 RepID=A0ABY8LDB0_9RHOB|nr:recombinase family protein [Jannaschia sp. GRR-S6-38]WGH78587.1 recombinase family protein [Jannaschia sp. GRR-S6-38]
MEAQRKAIDAFATSRRAEVIGRFTEVESGRKNERPELDKALNLAKLTGATLVIAKLDRLSRNAAFLLTLQSSGVRFLACDMPEANDLTMGIMALVAQGDLTAHQGGARGGKGTRGEARKPERGCSAPTGWQGRGRVTRGGRGERGRLCAGSGAGHRGDPRRKAYGAARDR